MLTLSSSSCSSVSAPPLTGQIFFQPRRFRHIHKKTNKPLDFHSKLNNIGSGRKVLFPLPLLRYWPYQYLKIAIKWYLCPCEGKRVISVVMLWTLLKICVIWQHLMWIRTARVSWRCQRPVAPLQCSLRSVQFKLCWCFQFCLDSKYLVKYVIMTAHLSFEQIVLQW